MKRKLSIIVLIVFALLYIGSSCTTSAPPAAAEDEIDATPCNGHALADAKSVLRYLAALSSPNVKKALVGQNCYHGDEITDSDPLNGYKNLVADLFDKTGQWVSIVGVDYEYMKIYSPQRLSNANKVLTAHWRKGGLVTVNFSPQNPWVKDETGAVDNSLPWDAPGSPTDRSQAALKELIDPSRPVSSGWRIKLDRIAAALQELRDAGVIVLWRPLQEMNGNWFWWGDDPSGYIAVYRDMFDYFTNVKKLDNLLWVYSPFAGIPDTRTYPGDQYVDIIAPTSYDDQLVFPNYNLYASLGSPRKPLGLGEYGPRIGGEVAKVGSLDTTRYIKRIRDDYPRVAYWVCWHYYPTDRWAIIGNQNYRALMNDPDVITLDRLAWKQK